MRRRGAGHTIAEAAVAVALVAGAIGLLGTLFDASSMQVARLEQRSPAHVRLSLGANCAMFVVDGGRDVAALSAIQVVRVQGRGAAENPSLFVEVKR